MVRAFYTDLDHWAWNESCWLVQCEVRLKTEGIYLYDAQIITFIGVSFLLYSSTLNQSLSSMYHFSHTQVCCGDCLQVCTKTRVGWQELGLLGTLPLQQLVGGTPQQQGNPHRAFAPPAAPWDIVGLRFGVALLLRCCGLAALVHIWHWLCSSSLPGVQCLE